MLRNFNIHFLDRRAITKESITNPGKVAKQLLNEAFEKFPEIDNQYWANRTLDKLSALYPWLRFLIIVGNEAKCYISAVIDITFLPNKNAHNYLYRRIMYNENLIGIFKGNNDTRSLHAVIYFTFATDRYEGHDLDCYGSLKDLFQGCDPNIDYIKKFVIIRCMESYGYIQVITDHNRTHGIAWNLPETALKIEEFQCQGPQADNKLWRFIYAPYQKIDNPVSFVANLVKGNSEKYSIPALGLTVSDRERHNTNMAPLYSIILLLLSIILSGAYLLYKMCKQCKGSIGFYFKLSWLFGIYTGENSRVYFARFRFSETNYRNIAVKMPSRDAFQMRAIIEETRIAAQLRHPRVVEYIGFYRDAFGDVRIVSEFMAGGDLHTHLSRRENEINVGNIFNFICQIAEGMEYLISQRIVHRNLAARNCIRRFNLDANYASSSPVCLPLRWMPIECFDNVGEPLRNCNFNEKTDVWAFGVLIWECFTRGAQPYESEDFKDVVLRLMKYKNKNNDEESSADGWPLAMPDQCPQILYDQVMLKCWASEQMNRSAFSSIRAKLDEVFDEIMTNNPDVLVQNVLFV